MRSRPAALARAHQRDLELVHRESALSRWRAAVPGSYRGHELNEAYDGWQGRLEVSGAAALRRYVQGPGSRFLLLQGGEGLGKSTLAATVVDALVARSGASALYRSAPVMLSSFSWREREIDPVAVAAGADVLLVDDLGAGNEGLSPVQERSLWSLLDARWADPSKRTVLTTNMAVADSRSGMGLAGYLGATGWARVCDDLVRLSLVGESFRGGGAR